MNIALLIIVAIAGMGVGAVLTIAAMMCVKVALEHNGRRGRE